MSKEVQISNLPRDVIFDILSRLPIKSLVQFTCVSKSALPLISHPHFIKLQLSRSTAVTDDAGVNGSKSLLLSYESMDYSTHSSFRCPITLSERAKLQFPFKSVYGYFRIVGSCNGLICFFDTIYFTYVGTLYLWNPSIKRFKILHMSHSKNETLSHMVIGFGFVTKINDFKIVKILYDLDVGVKPDVFIYTLRSDSWKKIMGFPPCFLPRRWANNVFVKTCVNWLAHKTHKFELFDCIMAFDLSDESFQAIEMPENRGSGYDDLCMCSSFREESLCLSFKYRQFDGYRWEMWVMKEYGVATSWTKQFTIVHSDVSYPFTFMDNGGILVVMRNGDLVCYDPNKQTYKGCGVNGMLGSFRLVNYISSLYLLDCKYPKGHQVT